MVFSGCRSSFKLSGLLKYFGPLTVFQRHLELVRIFHLCVHLTLGLSKYLLIIEDLSELLTVAGIVKSFIPHTLSNLVF